MKADHRKELQTNLLADRMGKLVEGFKNPRSTTSVVVWVIVGLAVATGIAWLWFSRPSEASALLWAKLDTDTFNKPEEYFSDANQRQVIDDLSDFAQKNRRTIPGRTARFQEARYLLPLGLKDLASPFRSNAYGHLDNARKIFEELAKECGDNPVLLQEAFLGAAKAEEALIGAPDPKDDSKTLGDVDKAKELYRKARDINKDSYLGQEAAQHYDLLDKDSSAVVKFYKDLNKRGDDARKDLPKSLDLDLNKRAPALKP